VPGDLETVLDQQIVFVNRLAQEPADQANNPIKCNGGIFSHNGLQPPAGRELTDELPTESCFSIY